MCNSCATRLLLFCFQQLKGDLWIAWALLTFQVKGESEAIYKPGERFYEAPNGIHLVSANAGQTAPLGFVAYFTCDQHVPLSTEVPENKSP